MLVDGHVDVTFASVFLFTVYTNLHAVYHIESDMYHGANL